jgi:hypothetical protein
MREIRLSGSEGGGANPIVSPYPYLSGVFTYSLKSVGWLPPVGGISVFHAVSLKARWLI